MDYSNFDYSSTSNLTSDQAAALGAVGGAFAGGMFVFMMVLCIALYVVMAVSLMKIAQKTGYQEKAWWAWIPVLNLILNYNMGGYSGWWMIVPFANVVVLILAWMKISVKCGKPDWLGILMIVSPLNIIIPLYLAFSGGESKAKA